MKKYFVLTKMEIVRSFFRMNLEDSDTNKN